MSDTERLAEIEARVGALTPGKFDPPAMMEFGANAYPDVRFLLDQVRTLTAELARTQRGAHTLGRVIEQQGHDVLDATGLHDWVDETGDGDWAAIWERLAELRPERDRLAEKVWQTGRELQGLVSTYTRAPGENGDRVADLLSGDAYRIGSDLLAALADPTPGPDGGGES